MALKLTKEISISFKVDEIMKDNCVCINGTCTTKYNTCLFFLSPHLFAVQWLEAGAGIWLCVFERNTMW